jgi:integral membrane protein
LEANEKMRSSLVRFKWIALLGGSSFIMLLFISMPLKYGWDILWPNQIVGMSHGILAVLYVFSLIDFSVQYKIKFTRILGFLVASFVPFGTFYAEKNWLRPISIKENQSV